MASVSVSLAGASQAEPQSVDRGLKAIVMSLLAKDEQLQKYLLTHHPTESVHCGALSTAAAAAGSEEQKGDKVCHSDLLL